MNERGPLDYTVWAVIAVLMLVLLWAVTRPVYEPFTELYFDNTLALPNESYDSVSFTYSVHNAEGVEVPYRVRYAVDYLDEDGVALRPGLRENDVLTVAAGSTVEPTKQLALQPPFRRARISVELPGKDQSIHFWVRYAGNSVEYPEFGKADIECLRPVTGVPSFSLLTVTAHATPGNGWPEMTLLHNGRRMGVESVASLVPHNYTFAVISEKDNVLELVYADDFYNVTTTGERVTLRNVTFFVDDADRAALISQNAPIVKEAQVYDNERGNVWNITIQDQFIEEITVGEDRNLFIDAVYAGSVPIPTQRFVVERGLPTEWFDCRNELVSTGALPSPGSLRLRVSVR